MEDFEQKTDSVEEEKTTSSEISCAEKTTENRIEMTANQDNEPMTEASAEAEGIRNPEEEKPDSRGKKILVPLLSFFVPVLLFGLAWANNGITYGGNVTPLIYDMDGQYMQFIASLRYLISGENSILFNWNINMGGNYLSAFAYYIASPINLLSVFFDVENLSDAVYLITLIKIGLCGINFSTYLKYGLSEKKVFWRDILFSSCYALMSYNFMYSMCIMWLDGVLMMPLVLLGVEKILDGKRGLVYFFSIISVFYCNYYISYMVGIFTAVYFAAGVLYRIRRGQTKKYIFASLHFGVNTVCALGLCMPMILPSLKSVSSGYQRIANGPNPQMYNFTFIDVLKKLLPQQYDSIEYTGLPSIFCGSLILVLTVLFFLQKRSIRGRIAALLILLVPLTGFVFPQMDFALHGFQYPHCYMYRYAFVFSFSIVALAYLASKRISMNGKWISLFAIAFTIYTFTEMCMNGAVIISELNLEKTYKTRDNKNAEYTLLTPLMKCAEERNSGLEFSRIGSQTHTTGNCSLAMYNMNGTESFASSFNFSLNRFLSMCGSNNMLQTVTARGNSALLNSILGIRYIVSSDDSERMYKLVEKTTLEDISLGLYENENALPLAFTVPRVVSCDIDPMENPFEAQNAMMLFLGWNDRVFTRMDSTLKKNGEEYSIDFSLPEGAVAYLSIIPDEEKMKIKDSEEDYLTVESKELHKLSYLEFDGASRTIDIENAHAGDNSITISGVADFDKNDYDLYYMYEDDYFNAVDYLKNGAAYNVHSNKNYVSLNVFSDENEALFTSIPYDEGWHIWVDGEETQKKKILDAFVCVFLNEGEHFVEFKYIPDGLYQGLCFAFASAVLSALYYGIYFVRFVKTKQTN